MEEKTVGIVSSPELPSTIANAIKKQLKKDLSRYIADGRFQWHVEMEVDLLAGATEKVAEVLEETERIKIRNGWDYAISLTDLPVYNGRCIVLADANVDTCTAQISLPAFGWLPTPNRVKIIMLHMIKELYFRHTTDFKADDLAQKGIGPKEQSGFLNKLEKPFRFSAVRRIESSNQAEETAVRFIIVPKINGLARILFGMTIANRPWTILPSLKNVVAIAFATGAYGLIFPTLWKLSVSYEIYRFIGLTATAVLGMVVWIIFSHDLWEKKNLENKNRLRWMYNSTTILTLGTSVVMYYIVLYLLFLIAVSVFVPPDLYQAEAGTDIGPLNYLKLAWLVTSVATFAGAIGAGLENPERVRKSTYSYRQYSRYEEMKEKEKQEDRKRKATDD
ncbi:hypothetical protein [Siminovitchia fortis]|uniref:5,10-methylene-tetrahydrofolate dehydrogenase n=1 Tax=Siminovitchia fortis TaxID=254758 RepID=A0A443ISI8_9BACI|nr:hypothetical protein [Siminovitchia fortis]RWR09644.1 hypothetical protein D4N35_010460 [Siminovitchia fortis]WHY82267.1 hypothetical protein QNH23_02335 [Siminovitchia fortis]